MPCPVCESTSHTVINEFTSRQVANAHLLSNVPNSKFEALKQHLEILWKNDKVRVLSCSDCELCYAEPFKAGDITFYELSSFDTPYPENKWEFDQTLGALGKYGNPKKTRVLEIGAGKGYFLEKLIHQKYSSDNLLALEFSSAGKSEIERKGIQCIQDDVRSVGSIGQYDVICMFQVLEHLDDHEALFAAIDRLASPHAHLFISVPYGKRINHNEANGLLLDTPPNHVSRWMPKSFNALGNRYSWNTVACELEPTTRAFEMQYSLVNRFLRKTQDIGSYPNKISVAASRFDSKRHATLMKAFGAFTTPGALAASAKAAVTGELIGHTLWVHFSREP